VRQRALHRQTVERIVVDEQELQRISHDPYGSSTSVQY
jgi:hypothetical protein